MDDVLKFTINKVHEDSVAIRHSAAFDQAKRVLNDFLRSSHLPLKLCERFVVILSELIQVAECDAHNQGWFDGANFMRIACENTSKEQVN